MRKKTGELIESLLFRNSFARFVLCVGGMQVCSRRHQSKQFNAFWLEFSFAFNWCRDTCGSHVYRIKQGDN